MDIHEATARLELASRQIGNLTTRVKAAEALVTEAEDLVRTFLEVLNNPPKADVQDIIEQVMFFAKLETRAEVFLEIVRESK